MKPRRHKRLPAQEETVSLAPTTIFSSDLLTPEEERELLSGFWDCKTELVRLLIRSYPELRANRPPLEPWPMAQFIREFCEEKQLLDLPTTARLYDRYVRFKHRLASANIRLAAHVAKR